MDVFGLVATQSGPPLDEILRFVGYASSLLIGLTIGLIGAGGSILSVPVLAYLFQMPAEAATGHSLFIVGVTAAIGAVAYFRRGDIDLKEAAVFGAPSIVMVFATRAFVVPAIPERLGPLTKDQALLILFAGMMIAASIPMIRGRKKSGEHKKSGYGVVLVEGAVVGFVTGLVGAGGGFLVVPALVLIRGLDMKKAVGTSLAIVASKSLAGFVGEVGAAEFVDWALLGSVTGLAILGLGLGALLSKKISGEKLKPAFGYFVLAMGAFVIGRELMFGGEPLEAENALTVPVERAETLPKAGPAQYQWSA